MLKACGILYFGVQIVMGLWISNLNRESVQLTTEGNYSQFQSISVKLMYQQELGQQSLVSNDGC
jgi:hypothetical protein